MLWLLWEPGCGKQGEKPKQEPFVGLLLCVHFYQLRFSLLLFRDTLCFVIRVWCIYTGLRKPGGVLFVSCLLSFLVL